MRCHYEILEVPFTADDAEIKTAYRKLALKWHPDKNPENPDLAKEQFQIVQQAYEVLSDKQERAWYDNHREQILHRSNSEFQDKSFDVFPYFTSTCFKGFGDDDAGFYTVYRNVFDEISKEDLEFMEKKQEFCQIPGFGRSDSGYEPVKAFYDYWMSYSTKKSYSWLDPYDIREGKGDRRLLKIIEKENKKSRLKARKERNEEVRNLVAFVRKRDKRVEAFKKEMEAKAMDNRKKQEELSKRKRLERNRLHANEQQADWLKFDNVKSELEQIERHLAQQFGEDFSDSEEPEEDFDNLYCVACNKIFKNPGAFQNHETSKKHRDNVEKLRESMLEEEDLSSNLTEDLNQYSEQLLVNENDLENISVDENQSSDDGSISIEDNMPELNTEANKSKKKKKKARNVINASENSINIDEIKPLQSDDDDNFDFTSASKSKKGKIRKNNKPKPTADEQNPVEQLENEEITKEATKKQTKKGKKAGKKVKDGEFDDIDLTHCCATCKNNFPSKNKLFEHLKKMKHGVYLSSNAKNKKLDAEN